MPFAMLAAGCWVLGAGVYMAVHDKQGWGWLLFIGFLIVGCVPIHPRPGKE